MSLYLEDMSIKIKLLDLWQKSFKIFVFTERNKKDLNELYNCNNEKIKIQNLTQIYLLFLNKIKVLITWKFLIILN